MVKQSKIPLKCYVLVFIFHCPIYYNLNVSGEPGNVSYLPSWEDLDARPLPQWYDSAKIGILIDWGVHSVPSLHEESLLSEWKNGTQEIFKKIKGNFTKPIRRYEDFAQMFKADKFEPEKWAELFAKSGARYVVVTAKYKDGFTMFSSERLGWNSVDVGPKRDIVRILSQSIKEYGLKFGVYYSLTEWHNKLFIEEKEQDTRKELNTTYIDSIIFPEIKLLLTHYEPSILWADGDNDVRCTSYWKTTDLLAWIYNESPVKDEIVVNDRWSSCTRCLHGDFFSNDNCYKEVVPHKWENPVRLDQSSLGYVRDMKSEDVLSITETLKIIVSTVSRGGNALIVVAPTKDGIIAPAFQHRLRQLGDWLEANGEAIYDTSRWIHQQDSLSPDVWYTCTMGVYHNIEGKTNSSIHAIRAVYAILLKWPNDNVLKLADLIPYITDEQVEISLIEPNDASLKYNVRNKKKTLNKKYIPVTNSIIGNTTLEVHLPSTKLQTLPWVLKVQFKAE